MDIAVVDLDFEHLPINSSVTQTYSTFLRSLSEELHKEELLSACVGNYPTSSNGISVFYDPAVLNETCDVVRVMNYDMYWVGGRGVASLASRPDCAGVGLLVTQPGQTIYGMVDSKGDLDKFDGASSIL